MVSYECDSKDNTIKYTCENETCAIDNFICNFKEGYYFDSIITIYIPLIKGKNSYKICYSIPRILKKFDSDGDAVKFSNERIIEHLDKMISNIEKSLNNAKDIKKFIENNICSCSSVGRATD